MRSYWKPTVVFAVRLCLLPDVRPNSSHVCSCNHINYESIIYTSLESHTVEFACTVYILCCWIWSLSTKKNSFFFFFFKSPAPDRWLYTHLWRWYVKLIALKIFIIWKYLFFFFFQKTWKLCFTLFPNLPLSNRLQIISAKKQTEKKQNMTWPVWPYR